MKILLSALFIFCQLALAVTASPLAIELTQPDDSKIAAYQKGDEWASWYETTNGWSIVKNHNGYWVYAIGAEESDLIPGNTIVGRQRPPTTDFRGQPLQRHYHPAPVHQVQYQADFNLNAARTDTMLIPLLLVDFPDHPASYSSAELNEVINGTGYGHPGHPGSGSFREFYNQISYDQFNPVTEIVDWETAPELHDYYGHNNPDYGSHVISLIRAMVDSAEANGMDWSRFDNDGDGYLDALNVIHSGPGAEEGDGSNIWSHKWYLSAFGQQVEYDGVVIDGYSINPEIQNDNIVAIGVIAHEFGHALGLPDLYDTDYSSDGAGKLALMASGSWGTAGNSPWYPSAMNAWCKSSLGWSNVVELIQDDTLVNVVQSFSDNTIYQVNHPSDDTEHWLIENRQKVGTDVNMPSAGLLMWHIDEEMLGGWGVNNEEPHYGVGLEQADGYFNLENNQGSDGGDPYPGSSNNHEFSNSSTPSTISYYGVPSMITIGNISGPDSVMSFSLTFGEILTADVNITNANGMAYDTGYVSLGITNDRPIATLEFELVGLPNILSVVTAELAGRASADSIIFDGNALELVNPVIPAGSGNIVEFTLFANTGVDANVSLTLDNYFAADTGGNEIALLVQEGFYQVNSQIQNIGPTSSSAPVGGPFSYQIDLNNTIPLKMLNFNITHTPDYLIPADETFTDANSNGQWDAGEQYIDWNEDGAWTPAVQLTDRMNGWNVNYQLTANGIAIQSVNWSSAVDPGSGPIFTINGIVDMSAPTSYVAVYLSEVFMMDIYGNTGVEISLISGGVSITPYVGTTVENPVPVKFALSDNYPNPFNPATSLNYQVPDYGQVRMAIYDLRGALVTEVNRQHVPGHYTFTWDGTNREGQALGSGTYFIKMTADGFSATRKVLLLK